MFANGVSDSWEMMMGLVSSGGHCDWVPEKVPDASCMNSEFSNAERYHIVSHEWTDEYGVSEFLR